MSVSKPSRRERVGLDSSLRVLGEAVRLDPRSAETLTEACISAYAVSRDSAEVYCERTARVEPDLFRGYLAVAWRFQLAADSTASTPSSPRTPRASVSELPSVTSQQFSRSFSLSRVPTIRL
jgi:hypothetical protein